jgi:tetratricopeptide (TPR) repeat protein
MYEIDKIIERGEQLRKLNRPQEAIIELQKALIVEPDNEEALNEIVLCFLELKDFKNAEESVNKLLTVIPDEAHPHYYKAFIQLQKDNYAKAEEHILEAISLNPYQSAFFGLLSGIYIERTDWKKALEYANQGLAIDPEDSTCLNYRTMCLTKLDRHDEIGDSIDDALKSNPYDAHTHANVGWTKLEINENEQAKAHFAEALRINPNFEYARLGMVEAIKAKNPLYRLFLKYQFFMSKYSASGQMAIIVGLAIGRNFIRSMSTSFPILLPVFYFLGFLFFLTWVMKPFGDIFLRLDNYGKLVLSEKEKRSSEIVGVGILIGIFSAICYLSTDYAMWFTSLIVSFGIIIPLSDAVEYDFFRNKNYLPAILIIFLIICGAISLYSVFIQNEESQTIVYFTYGIVAYMWLLNLGIIKRII